MLVVAPFKLQFREVNWPGIDLYLPSVHDAQIHGLHWNTEFVFTGTQYAHDISMKSHFKRPCTLGIVIFSTLIRLKKSVKLYA